MTVPPEGDRPGGEEPTEGVPPEELDSPEEVAGELPDLEPEFVEALRDAAEGSTEPGDETRVGEQAPIEEAEPVAEDEPTEERPRVEAPEAAAPDSRPDTTAEPTEGETPPAADESKPADTQEFTPKELSDAQQPHKHGEEDGKPRRTVVIGAGPEAPPAEGSATSAPPPGAPAAPTPTAPPPAPTPAQPAAPAPPGVPAAPRIPQKPPPEGDFEPAPKGRRLWLRFLIASVLIIGSMASATSASVLLYFGDIAGKLGGLRGVKRQLLPTEAGEPENILILGSDKRASEPGTKGLSDTTILLRLDPDHNAIALMSIPRDLKTYIPGVGVSKFNIAYALGGPKLTLRTVKRVTGLPINHVVNVDFLGFVRAVNAINCVYVDVDRRYFHSNLGLPPSQQYAEIDIDPGYQRLCGKDALEYARYRHTDTDLVRAARQQDFLREARQQVPASDLFFSKRKELIDIFTSYTTSDIDNGETMLQVLKLFVAARNAPIKEIHFPAVLHPSYVTASKAAIQGAVEKFLGIEASGGPRGALDLPRSSGNTGIVPEQRKRARAAKQAKQEPKAPGTPTPGNDGLVDASQFSHDLAAQAAARTLRSFPVFYPRRLPSGSIYVQEPRIYHLRDTEKNSRGAYKFVLQLPQGDYFGFQGVHGWPDPPILKDPNESRTMNGRSYDIYLDGDRVRMVAWHQGDNSYWVSNSLLQTLTNDQMLGIARSIGKLPGERQRRHRQKSDDGVEQRGEAPLRGERLVG